MDAKELKRKEAEHRKAKEQMLTDKQLADRNLHSEEAIWGYNPQTGQVEQKGKE